MTDDLFTPYFEGLSDGHLSFPRCDDCRGFHWYPTSLCPHCRSSRITWEPVAGEATVYSWTTIHHAFDPSLDLTPPYVVALLEFSDAPGVRLVANIVDTDLTRLHIGARVVPRFPDSASASRRLTFTLEPVMA